MALICVVLMLPALLLLRIVQPRIVGALMGISLYVLIIWLFLPSLGPHTPVISSTYDNFFVLSVGQMIVLAGLCIAAL